MLRLLVRCTWRSGRMIYFPDKTTPDISPYVAEGLQEVAVQTEDGLNLTAWLKKPEGDKETIVFFHGNASNHLGNVYMAAPYMRDGYGFLSVGYRGYSGNAGKPSEQGFYADARASLKALIDSGLAPENIILYGQSYWYGCCRADGDRVSGCEGVGIRISLHLITRCCGENLFLCASAFTHERQI